MQNNIIEAFIILSPLMILTIVIGIFIFYVYYALEVKFGPPGIYVGPYGGFDKGLLGGKRSPKWKDIRKDFLILNPKCAVCMKKGTFLKPIEVHHKKPYHLYPELELDTENLITLCRSDHLLFGHLNSWSSLNSGVVEDCLLWRGKIINRL